VGGRIIQLLSYLLHQLELVELVELVELDVELACSLFVFPDIQLG
jgi:hypothetical protein